jgi:hypothetical protein
VAIEQRSFLACLFAILSTLSGCAATSPTTIDQWADDYGGVMSGGSQQVRAERALGRLAASGAISRRLRIAVLDTDRPVAFCWRSGSVLVGRGLVELLDDDELCAAVAHEAGHLLVDGHLPGATALDGCRRTSGRCAAEDAEVAADLMGRELLRASSVPEDALARLLNTLALHGTTAPTCRDHLARRMAKLAAPLERS